MKALIVSPDLPWPLDHGGRIRTSNLLRALSRLGEVVLAAPAAGARERVESVERAFGVRVERLPHRGSSGPSKSRKLAEWLRGRSELLSRRWDTSARTAVADLIDRESFDVLVVDTTFALPAIPSGLQMPRILHLVNVESRVLTETFARSTGRKERLLSGIESRHVQRLESSAVGRADCTIVMSDDDRAALQLLVPGARIEVIGPSVDLDQRPLLPPSKRSVDEPLILYVGSFAHPPNGAALEYLIGEHLPKLRARWPNLMLRVVGRDHGDFLDAFQGLAGVEVVGHAPNLTPHYREAHAAYLPVLSGSGTRMRAVEAWALGRPLIATHAAVEGLGLLEGEGWLSCETPDAGIQSLARVLEGGARDVTKVARTQVERHFTNQRMIDRSEDLVRSIVGDLA